MWPFLPWTSHYSNHRLSVRRDISRNTDPSDLVYFNLENQTPVGWLSPGCQSWVWNQRCYHSLLYMDSWRRPRWCRGRRCHRSQGQPLGSRCLREPTEEFVLKIKFLWGRDVYSVIAVVWIQRPPLCWTTPEGLFGARHGCFPNSIKYMKYVSRRLHQHKGVLSSQPPR